MKNQNTLKQTYKIFSLTSEYGQRTYNEVLTSQLGYKAFAVRYNM